jgi:hypothetical protein
MFDTAPDCIEKIVKPILCLALTTFLMTNLPARSHAAEGKVGPVPEEIRKEFGLSDFYQKHIGIEGFPIVGSEKVSDFALLEAHFLIKSMIGDRKDILAALVKSKTRYSVMAYDELTTQIPEHSDLTPKKYWDRRARGLGASRERPSVSCGEENLLGYPGDPYATENILIHEFAHAIHLMGINNIDDKFDNRLKLAFDRAMADGKWKDKYASSNKNEYWAEAVQSWFGTNRENDHDHNHVNTPEELKEYDPGVAKLCEEIFGADVYQYQHPARRKEPGHLAGYDPAEAPTFAWPKDLKGDVPRFLPK